MIVWKCKIGSTLNLPLPEGADRPMRRAVEKAYLALTGEEAEFNFSGWGGTLSKEELEAVLSKPEETSEDSS